MLQNKAMLARLTIHAWTARKKDKKASAEIEQNHGAKEAGNYIKLLVDKKCLEPFQKQDGKIREFVNKNTLAWGDAGERLLPSARFMAFTKGVRDLIAEADRLADEFAQNYPQMRQDARAKLGTLYDPMDYPAESDIRRRFAVELEFLPVPDAKDFRVDVSESEKEAIRKQITDGVEARQKQATRECWDRLYTAVYKIDEVLSKDKPRIFDSLIDTPKELVEILPALNFAGDKRLDEMCKEVNERLLQLTPDDLRTDAALRAEIGRRANHVVRKIDEQRKQG